MIRIGTSGWALAWQAAGLDVYAYFNNNQAGYAVVNAQQMKQRAGLPAPQPA